MNHKQLEDKLIELSSKVRVMDLALQPTVKDLLTRVANLELRSIGPSKESFNEVKLYALEDWVKEIVEINNLITESPKPQFKTHTCRHCGAVEHYRESK